MVINKLRKRNNEEETIETEEAMDVEIVEEVIENEVEEIVVDNDEEIEVLDCEENYVPKHKMINKINKSLLAGMQYMGRKLVKLGNELNNIDENEYDVEVNEKMLIFNDYKKKCLRKIKFMKLKLSVRIKCVKIVYDLTNIVANICSKLENYK
jgi:hypothetical protein